MPMLQHNQRYYTFIVTSILQYMQRERSHTVLLSGDRRYHVVKRIHVAHLRRARHQMLRIPS